jgi:hypothetical protein
MNIQDLKKRYDVLTNPDLFDTKLECGLSLPIEIIEDEFAFGFEEAGLDAGEDSVPSAIKQLCSVYNGFSVKWHYLREIEKGYPVMGFTSYPDAYGFVKRSITHEGRRLFLLDDFLDMWKVYVQLSAEEQKHKLYYLNSYEKKYYPMCITADVYIEKAGLSRGLTNWQEFFFEDRNYESDEGNRARFRKELTTIFPDVPFEEFIQI